MMARVEYKEVTGKIVLVFTVMATLQCSLSLPSGCH